MVTTVASGCVLIELIKAPWLVPRASEVGIIGAVCNELVLHDIGACPNRAHVNLLHIAKLGRNRLRERQLVPGNVDCAVLGLRPNALTGWAHTTSTWITNRASHRVARPTRIVTTIATIDGHRVKGLRLTLVSYSLKYRQVAVQTATILYLRQLE